MIYMSAKFSYDPIYHPESELVISNSTFDFDDSKCGTNVKRVTLIGYISNETDTAFKNIVISINYFDESDKVIDVIHDEIYDLIVPPKSTQTFRVTGQCTQDTSRYVRAEAKVSKAEPDGWF